VGTGLARSHGFYCFFKEMDMTQITGQNFIGGQRSGAGAVHLQSLDATTGEALPYQFVQATDAEVDSAANAASAAFAAFRSCPPAAVRNFKPLPKKSTRWATSLWPLFAVKPPCPPGVFRVSAAAPAGRCVCLPKSCAVAIFMARGSIRPARPPTAAPR
jgi:hypothetical protein